MYQWNIVFQGMCITRHSQVWHWYIHWSPLLKTRWWNSWCLQDAAGLHWGQHTFFLLFGKLQSHMGSLQVIIPSWQVHLLQASLPSNTVSLLLTSRPSNQQPVKQQMYVICNSISYIHFILCIFLYINNIFFALTLGTYWVYTLLLAFPHPASVDRRICNCL